MAVVRRPPWDARRSRRAALNDYSLFTIYHSLLTYLLQLAQALGDAAVGNVYGVDFGQDFDGAVGFAELLVGRAEVVAHGLVLVLGVAGRGQAALEPERGGARHALLHEAVAEHVAAVEVARRAVAGRDQVGRGLELFDRLIEQAHLAVGEAPLVARVEVAARGVLVRLLDRLAELVEDFGQPGVKPRRLARRGRLPRPARDRRLLLRHFCCGLLARRVGLPEGRRVGCLRVRVGLRLPFEVSLCGRRLRLGGGGGGGGPGGPRGRVGGCVGRWGGGLGRARWGRGGGRGGAAGGAGGGGRGGEGGGADAEPPAA